MTEKKLAPSLNGSAGATEWPGISRRVFTPEEIEEFLRRLREPFDPSLVEWVVTATTKGRGGKLRGQAAAYADQRAYTDRLNGLFTPAGWTREYTVQVVQNFERGKDNRVIAAKVMVACRLTIFALGSHSGTGEEWPDDQNALTRAEAQAFKRACVCFGLGRYFCDLPRTWVDLDNRKRPLQLPQLPAWALPQGGNGGRNGATGTAKGRSQGCGNGRLSVGAIDARKQSELAKQIQELSKRIGRGLSAYVVRSVAGVEQVEQVAEVQKLTKIAERMENAARGVVRLKKASGLVGAEVHGALCVELQLPSKALDDIPDTRVLRVLVERLEEQARSKTLERPSAEQGGRTEQEKAETKGEEPVMQFDQLRGCLLAEARRVSTASGIGMNELVAKASGGAFQFGDIATWGRRIERRSKRRWLQSER